MHIVSKNTIYVRWEHRVWIAPILKHTAWHCWHVQLTVILNRVNRTISTAICHGTELFYSAFWPQYLINVIIGLLHEITEVTLVLTKHLQRLNVW
jgi:hypothetical protein